MISGKLKNVDAAFNSINRMISKIGDRIANTLLEEVRKATPIDKGRARRGWKKSKSANPTLSNSVERQIKIENRVPYIGLLERGRSKQAPNGIVRQSLSATLRNKRRIR